MRTFESDSIVVDGREVPGTITFTAEHAEVPPSLAGEPVKDWTYTDNAGHDHYYDDGYPTLVPVGPPVLVVGECRRCGERIYPERDMSGLQYKRYEVVSRSWEVEVDSEFLAGADVDVCVEGYGGAATVARVEGGRSLLVGQGGLAEPGTDRA